MAVAVVAAAVVLVGSGCLEFVSDLSLASWGSAKEKNSIESIAAGIVTIVSE